MNIAILISGTGHTLDNLIQHSKKHNTFQIKLVGANQACPGLTFAKENDIMQWVYTDIGDNICYAANNYDIDLICLAGFLKKVKITPRWENRVLNIHPALLPEFGGKGMYGMNVHEAVIESGAKESGCTVHYCDEKYDHGEILLQRRLDIEPEWNAQDLAKAVFALEKETYPRAIEILCE